MSVRPPMTSAEASLMLALQRGIPLVSRPFAEVGRELGMGEDTVLASVEGWRQQGKIRRFGAVFDSRRLGYESTLCAMQVRRASLQHVLDVLEDDRAITHCYLRDHAMNLWFTYTARCETFSNALKRLAVKLGGRPFFELPAVRRFKVNVIFGRRRAASPYVENQDAPGEVQVEKTDKTGRSVVRAIQGDLTIGPELFAPIASRLNLPEVDLLRMLTAWKRKGILRRIAPLLYHYRLGISANVMCVWRVDDKKVEATGDALARRLDVSHCYERRPAGTFPYNLFAMVHADKMDDALALGHELSSSIVGEPVVMLPSIRELIKRSAVFFE